MGDNCVNNPDFKNYMSLALTDSLTSYLFASNTLTILKFPYIFIVLTLNFRMFVSK
jgi:hypothetical protein